MNVIGSKLLKRLVLAVIAVVSLTAVLSGCSLIKDAGKSDTAKSKVGDCINVQKASRMDAETEPVDCSKPEAVYQVVSVNDGEATCDKGYTKYTESRGSKTKATLCLMPKLIEGQCYSGGGIMSSGYKYVSCTASEASFKVLKKVTGVADESACKKVKGVSKYITVEKEKVTYCTGSAKS